MVFIAVFMSGSNPPGSHRVPGRRFGWQQEVPPGRSVSPATGRATERAHNNPAAAEEELSSLATAPNSFVWMKHG